MKAAKTIAAMKRLRPSLAEPVGFVPTMGCLHQGHLSLIRQARAENRTVVASIFVNPAQFAPGGDFKRYPRNPEGDLALLKKEGVDVAFLPSVNEMYPPQFDSWVEPGSLARRLEGASRPGHFRGVATIVTKLFNIIQPARAYFGQKDAQQAVVIKKVVRDLNISLEIVTLPTVREPDGLAMSSRNRYLNHGERQAANVLYRTLCLAQNLWSQDERDAGRIRQEMLTLLQKEPLAEIDYVSIANLETLEEMDEAHSGALVSLAVKISSTRLIDNIVLE
jgi:pantoate--beta-alanine ligase